MFGPVVTVLLVCSFAPAPLPRSSPVCYFGVDAKQVDGGVVVETIYISAPAGDGGIMSEDVLVSIDGRPIQTLNDLAAVLRRTKAGTTVPVIIKRGGEEQRLEVRMAARRNFPFLGVSLGTTTISDLPENSPARMAGLREGDTILSVDGKNIRTREEVVAAIRDHRVGDKVEVVVNRDGSEVKATVTLGARPGY